MKPSDLGFSMPAEWAPHSGCWMGWPQRDSIWHGYIEAARDDYARVAQAIARFEPVTMLADPGTGGGRLRQVRISNSRACHADG